MRDVGSVARRTHWLYVLQIILRPSYVVPLVVFVTFILLNLGINGPAYLSDEIGYLDKAATVAGSVVHVSSSWFGGYPLMISPAFIVSPDPFIEWRIILVLNALMWAGSAVLLAYVLARLRPKSSLLARRLAVLGAMLYPAWISMSGYAFSTPGFVLVYMATIAALLKSDFRRWRWLLVAGVLSGYLAWIHPLGLLFVALFLGLIALQGVVRKQWGFLLIALASVATTLSYLTIVHPLFDRLMSGSLNNDTHYGSLVSRIATHLTSPAYWAEFSLVLAGLTLYLLVATFGLALYAALPSLRLLAKPKAWKATLLDTPSIVIVLTILAVVAVLVFTALSTPGGSRPRVDQWVYGRYTDLYILPLLGLGLLALWRARSGLAAAGFVLIAGVALSLFTNSDNTRFAYDNKVNIQGLWPMHVASIIHANSYWVWGMLGATGIVFTAWLGQPKRKVWLLALIVPVALCMLGNYIYHRTILQYTTVSSIYQDIKTHYQPQDCIGFAPGDDPHWHFSLYSYYLHGYDMRRIPISQWLAEGCRGPYLTYDRPTAASGLRVVGYNKQDRLYLLRPDRRSDH